MRVTKKIELLLFLLLSGCTALESNFNNNNSIYSDLGKINLESSRVGAEARPTSKKQLTNEEITLTLNEVKNSWTRGGVAEITLSNQENSYEIKLGEYLKIPNIGMKKIEVIGANPAQYELLNRDATYFRALYSGDYILKLTRGDESYFLIRVKNNIKYDFTENETYDIILNNYNNKNYKEALKGIDLYKIVFPKSLKSREIDFLALDIFLLTGDLREGKELQKNLKNLGTPNSKELNSLFRNELKINGIGYGVEEYYINASKNNPEFSLFLKEFILSKNIKTVLEKNFLKELYFKTLDPNLRVFAEENSVVQSSQTNFGSPNLPMEHLEMAGIETPTKIENKVENRVENSSENIKRYFDLGVTAYERGRYSEAVIQLEKIPVSQRDYDTSFYLGDSYFRNENYSKSIESYNRYLSSSDTNIRKAEARYNLAVSYDRIGNKREAENALKKVIELFPGTSWSRKSNIYMIRLKNN